MRLSPFHKGRLVFVVAAMQLFFGLAIYALPREFRVPAYDPVRAHFPLLSTLFVAGAVILLLGHRYPLSPLVRRTLILVPAGSFALLAWLFGNAAVWTGMVHYGVVAVALVIMPWLPSEGEVEQNDLGQVSPGLILSVIGFLMLVGHRTFDGASYRPIHPVLPLFGVIGLLGAASLLISSAGRRFHWLPDGAVRLVGQLACHGEPCRLAGAR